MRGAAALVALVIAPSGALRVAGGRFPPPTAADAAKAALVAGALSASLIGGAPPALAQV